jgi:hypothetical protein
MHVTGRHPEHSMGPWPMLPTKTHTSHQQAPSPRLHLPPTTSTSLCSRRGHTQGADSSVRADTASARTPQTVAMQGAAARLLQTGWLCDCACTACHTGWAAGSLCPCTTSCVAPPVKCARSCQESKRLEALQQPTIPKENACTDKHQ